MQLRHCSRQKQKERGRNRTFMRWTLLLLAGCTPPMMMPPTVDAGGLQKSREACEFKAGALPAETLPPVASMPFENIVLVMQENRSFDHYYSKLSHGGVRVAPPDAGNL